MAEWAGMGGCTISGGSEEVRGHNRWVSGEACVVKAAWRGSRDTRQGVAPAQQAFAAAPRQLQEEADGT
jgi:hypothetical protein